MDMTKVFKNPVMLMAYDSDDDCGRGTADIVGYYRTREAGEAEAKRLNDLLLAGQNAVKVRFNAEELRDHHVRLKQEEQEVWEHNFLVHHGMRDAALKEFVPTECISIPLKEELLIFTYKGTRNGRYGTENHFYVEEIEFDG